MTTIVIVLLQAVAIAYVLLSGLRSEDSHPNKPLLPNEIKKLLEGESEFVVNEVAHYLTYNTEAVVTKSTISRIKTRECSAKKLNNNKTIREQQLKALRELISTNPL